MLFGNISFNEIPEIGFAHKHYSHNYGVKYGNNKNKRIEIAYINSGTVELNLENHKLYAERGSILVLFRHLQIQTQTLGEELNSHCTVLAEFTDYDFTLMDEYKNDGYGFIIPFVTPPCAETEEIGKKIYSISAAMSKERDKNALSSAVEFLSILKKLDEMCKKSKAPSSVAYKAITDKVYSYVNNNIDKKINLEDLSLYIGKSQNHISYAFKCETGKKVTQFINEQKAKRIASLMQNQGHSFKSAVSFVGLCDESYGYRIFKKYIGVTPKEYMTITTIKKD